MQTRIWHGLRGEAKIYGMAILGVVFALIGCLIAMIFLGVMWSVGGALPGYFIGEFLSKTLHDGKAQRFLRWYFPNFAGKSLSCSSIRSFF
jgi:hypothetical protein